MYCIFSIHSSVDGHLGCFHALAIVNSVAVYTGVHVSFLNEILEEGSSACISFRNMAFYDQVFPKDKIYGF